jgi:hypothetical protein
MFEEAQWPELDTLCGSASDQVTLTLVSLGAYPCASHSDRRLERTASVADPFSGVNPHLSGSTRMERAPSY